MKFSTKLSAVGSALAIAGVIAFSGPALADQVRAQYISVQGDTIVSNRGGGLSGLITFDREELLGTDTGPEFAGTLVSNGGPPGSTKAW